MTNIQRRALASLFVSGPALAVAGQTKGLRDPWLYVWAAVVVLGSYFLIKNEKDARVINLEDS
jgi:hypothetical protein